MMTIPSFLPSQRGGLAAAALASTMFLAGCQHEPIAIQSSRATSPGAMTAEESALKARLPEKITAENHALLMDTVLEKPRIPIRSIGILVYEGVNDLDFTGPRYVLGQSGAQTRLVGLRPGPIKTIMGVQVMPDTTIDEVKSLDILVIPGGFTQTVEAAYDPRVLDWIRAIDRTTTYTASVCNGGWILGATGLLRGKRATTNWYRREEFLAKYGAIPTNDRYVHDGKYWTAAGVTAGIDMSLAIIEDNWGPRYTQSVMLDMEYDPAPPISGGSPAKTNPLVLWMMKSMYDAGFEPLIEKMENPEGTARGRSR